MLTNLTHLIKIMDRTEEHIHIVIFQRNRTTKKRFMRTPQIIFLVCCTLLFSLMITTSNAVDTISADQTIRDDENGTIVSAGGVFELGFFSPGSSKNRYVGIWYKKISNRTVVWVANRDTPVIDTSGVLKIDGNGSLELIGGAKNGRIWSSNSSRFAMNTVAQLLDSGNLVIRYENDTDPDDYIWQSFGHFGNQNLPGMKLGWDLVKGIERYFTSWKSADDPSPGEYTYRINIEGYPQPIVYRGSVVQYRLGPWDGVKFSGTGFAIPNPDYIANFVFDENEIYYQFQHSSSSDIMRGILDLDGNVKVLLWTNQSQSWETIQYLHKDDCDQYALCGSYGSCNITRAQKCGCLKGFEPKNAERWKSGEWSDGCVRKIELGCGNGDGFLKYMGFKLPDTRRSWFNTSMNLEECEMMCLKNCSCTAYSNIDIREGGVGCILWFDDLIDIRDYRKDVLDLYVRVAAAELEAAKNSGAKGGKKIKVIAASVMVSVVLVLLGGFCLFKKRTLNRKVREGNENENESKDLDLPLFDFEAITNATNNFSQENKLGQGGFGPVYKGVLDDGQEIAVKRLSKTSTQGLDEFKNEVSIVAKLQHRNLVKLLGCCIKEGEMLLIYEYMPNRSLDFFIFDKEQSKSFDWPKRYNIIMGIARGLLYLHQDSTLRIIHRDLKAGNILLDYDMNPRISDFGMARSFGGSEAQKTKKVVGTFGYMSPEYALDGTFSVKSDVYSFGVLLLEIVSGTKIRGFYHPDPGLNLLGHAWGLYKEGKVLELVDETILESCNRTEVSRVIQMGLLCVQSYPEDRPNMSYVVLMLSTEAQLPEPNQPGFFIAREPHESNSPLRPTESCSYNKLSVTIAPR